MPQTIDLSKLTLTEKWALVAKLREQRDGLDTNLRILRDSVAQDEAELAKKAAELKLAEQIDETKGIPPIPSPLEDNQESHV